MGGLWTKPRQIRCRHHCPARCLISLRASSIVPSSLSANGRAASYATSWSKPSAASRSAEGLHDRHRGVRARCEFRLAAGSDRANRGLASRAGQCQVVRVLAAVLARWDAIAPRAMPNGGGHQTEPAGPRRDGAGRAPGRHTGSPFTPYPTPLRDRGGNLIGAINLLVTIRDHRDYKSVRRRALDAHRARKKAVPRSTVLRDTALQVWNGKEVEDGQQRWRGRGPGGARPTRWRRRAHARAPTADVGAPQTRRCAPPAAGRGS
jgi:hypothetical protein